MFYNNNYWVSSRNINNNVSKKKKKNNLQCLNIKDGEKNDKNQLFNLIMSALNKKKSKSTKKENKPQKEEIKEKIEKEEEKEKSKDNKILEKNEEESRKTVILNESKNNENNDEEKLICGNLLNNSFKLKKNSKSDLTQNSFLLLYSNLCCDENEMYDESNLKYLYALANENGEKDLDETETPLKTNHFGSEKDEDNSGVLTYNEVKDIIVYYDLTDINKDKNYLFKKDERDKFDKNSKKKYVDRFFSK